MAWSRRHYLAIWALGVGTTFVNAQAFYGGDQSITCSAEDNFVDFGCFLGDLRPTLAPFSPQAYSPTDPSRSYPGFDPGSIFNNTVTPQNCATACRGFGYRTAILYNGGCGCGYGTPVVSLPLGTCDFQCPGDSSQTCGGGSSSRVYIDPSFADPGVLTALSAPELADDYEYLGCFYQSNSFPAAEDAAVTVQPSMELCLEQCALLGYPLARGAFSAG